MQFWIEWPRPLVPNMLSLDQCFIVVLQGAARMVLTTGAHPAAIKDSVTTPGGCTIAGLLTMEDGRIRSTLARTIQEAATVASTLGRDKK